MPMKKLQCPVLASRAQSRALDERAASFGLSAEKLMERAGARAAQWIFKKYPKARFFSVFCGPGHNGGDGWAAARHLKQSGREAAVYASNSSNPLFQIQRQRAAASGVLSKKWSQWKPAKGEILIDALFGSGLSREVKGEYFGLISRIRESGLPAVSLDLPSGLCADTGQVLGIAIKARHTLAFALGKPGLYLSQGPALAGEIDIIPLDIPKDLINQACNKYFLVSKGDAAPFLPSFPATANKSHRGRTLIAAGQKGMWGCGLLACRGAFVSGSGYVCWASGEYPYEGAWESPEILTARLNDPDLFERQTAAAAGPGLGFSPSAKKFLLRLQRQNIPLVLDADALTLMARENAGAGGGKAPSAEKKSVGEERTAGPDKRSKRDKTNPRPPALQKNGKSRKIPPFLNFSGASRLMTPHSGELSRLLGIPSRDIDSDRLRFAERGAKAMGCWLLLKGLRSVLSDGEKSYIINSGNAALGKAGTGDVLTGMAAGLLAQGMALPEAALLAASLHGEAAERWLRKGRDVNSFSAGALLDELPLAMSEFRALASGRIKP